MDIELLACGSEENDSRDLANSCGWNYLEAKNNPLTWKHNSLFNFANYFKHDAVMLIGSDDLVSREIIEYYQQNYNAESECVVGFNTLHFYSVSERKLIYFKGFTKDRSERVTMGAGRLFPKKVLEKINYRPWDGTKRAMNRGLDTICSRWLVKNGIEEREIKLDTIPGAMILDIKTAVNLTEFKRVLVNCNECDAQIAFDKFPEEMDLISKLK